jgi:hypothetical protein
MSGRWTDGGRRRLRARRKLHVLTVDGAALRGDVEVARNADDG